MMMMMMMMIKSRTRATKSRDKIARVTSALQLCPSIIFVVVYYSRNDHCCSHLPPNQNGQWRSQESRESYQGAQSYLEFLGNRLQNWAY